MTVVFRDANLKKVDSRVSAACVADFEGNLADYVKQGVVFLDFHLPLLNEQQLKKQEKWLAKKRDEEEKRNKKTNSWGFSTKVNRLSSLLSGEVCTSEELATEEIRKQWIADIRSLYNFDPFISYVHPKGKFVRFDFRKVSGFVMFAIITCLRYYTENPCLVSSMYDLMHGYDWNFKESFIFAHLLNQYSPGHSLLHSTFDYEKALAVEGVNNDKPLTLGVLEKVYPLTGGASLNKTFSYHDLQGLMKVLVSLKRNEIPFTVIKKTAKKLNGLSYVIKLIGAIDDAQQ